MVFQRRGPWVLSRRAHRHRRNKYASLMEKQHWGSLDKVAKGNEVWKIFQTKGNDGVENRTIF